ncbi:hypothetical protein PsYK624_095740 [Phanerochaete sordida]|uniref:Uncharacterized protein n=1 Tax=Phanerochaete sordida TaxID=48140 RepID=A0A9P3LFL5_9APHY|nr:hypothetical protein PsYK624_095740 [Phanerochaete sordida]
MLAFLLVAACGAVSLCTPRGADAFDIDLESEEPELEPAESALTTASSLCRDRDLELTTPFSVLRMLLPTPKLALPSLRRREMLPDACVLCEAEETGTLLEWGRPWVPFDMDVLERGGSTRMTASIDGTGCPFVVVTCEARRSARRLGGPPSATEPVLLSVLSPRCGGRRSMVEVYAHKTTPGWCNLYFKECQRQQRTQWRG